MRMNKKMMALGAWLALSSAWASANGLEQLRAFLASTQSGKADFSQTVVAKSGKKAPQTASGSFAFARPGKFRWNYETPYAQLLVSDGVKLWVWDKDLNQVTVKKLGQALSSTPAALLAGDNALEKNFQLKDMGEDQGLAWVEAQPKANDSSFALVRIGMKGDVPQRMDITDNFGHTTHLLLERFQRNANPDPSQFRFTPPKGADVVGE